MITYIWSTNLYLIALASALKICTLCLQLLNFVITTHRYGPNEANVPSFVRNKKSYNRWQYRTNVIFPQNYDKSSTLFVTNEDNMLLEMKFLHDRRPSVCRVEVQSIWTMSHCAVNSRKRTWQTQVIESYTCVIIICMSACDRAHI